MRLGQIGHTLTIYRECENNGVSGITIVNVYEHCVGFSAIGYDCKTLLFKKDGKDYVIKLAPWESWYTKEEEKLVYS